tara:strand:- start:114 stop:683 length:570 start_codon:yes stop_codon:yes gene_type:complete
MIFKKKNIDINKFLEESFKEKIKDLNYSINELYNNIELQINENYNRVYNITQKLKLINKYIAVIKDNKKQINTTRFKDILKAYNINIEFELDDEKQVKKYLIENLFLNNKTNILNKDSINPESINFHKLDKFFEIFKNLSLNKQIEILEKRIFERPLTNNEYNNIKKLSHTGKISLLTLSEERLVELNR